MSILRKLKPRKSSSIVFFHGLGGCKDHFDNSHKYFSGIRNLSFDLIGFGKNRSKLNINKPILPQQIKFIQTKISKLKTMKIILVFHSLSTILIPQLFKYKNISKKISHIILIEGDIIDKNLQWSKKLSEMNKSSFKQYINKFKKNSSFIIKAQLVKKNNYKRKYSKCFTDFNVPILRKFCQESIEIIKKNYVLNFLKKRKTKKLLIISSSNKNLYTKTIRSIFNKTIIIKNSGHYPMIDDPKSTYQAIERFI